MFLQKKRTFFCEILKFNSLAILNKRTVISFQYIYIFASQIIFFTMQYNKLNNLVGWLVFLIATTVYFMTIESTASLWDCGEYITAAYKLEVGHPPGAPLFMVLGRLFSFFAEPAMVAVWINRLSALSSSFTILFMFWSITMLAKKMLQRNNRDWTKGDQIAALGAGIVGALAYTFSDSFWFSAVEGEVYAMSSLFSAAIFWAILKWDAEMTAIKFNELTGPQNPSRWLILIMFLFGLAIGVHLLGLLAVPSIAFVMYFQLWEKVNLKGIIITGIISVVSLAFIQEGVIPGIVAIASSFEVTFVNTFGLPFFSGTVFFFIVLIALVAWGINYAIKKAKPLLSTILWGFVVLLIGYGSFAVIVIRSNANTPLDENDPENLVTLHAYLKREQYGSWPILNGNHWNSLREGEVMIDGEPQLQSTDSWGDLSPFYLKRNVVMLGNNDIKAFKDKAKAEAYAKAKGRQYTVVEKYFSSNEKVRHNNVPVYSQSTFLPRMYYQGAPSDPKIIAYKNWSGYDPNDGTATELGNDGLRLPSFSENLNYMFGYQINWMYWRYFMWNFSGRQNDIQGHGDALRGNWISGFATIDNERLGDQDAAPFYTKENPSHNNFFMLPFILGIVGLVFHFYRAPKDAFVVFLMFLFTGLAIVVYLNQKPFEPRERDYAYAASFYAFAFWIGLGVIAIYEAYKNFTLADWKGLGKGTAALSAFVFIIAASSGFTTFTTWIIIVAIGAALLGLGFILRKVIPNNTIGAALITVIAGIVPFIMAEQGWDDHDRSGKTSARDLANNYLMSCAPNSILFTVGDNDTFPLWYLQEVEGKHTDKRVCNTSLFDTDWYTDQMMLKTYQSDALPISFREDQILMWEGGTDQVYFVNNKTLLEAGVAKETLDGIFKAKLKSNKAAFVTAYASYQVALKQMVDAIQSEDAATNSRLSEIRSLFATGIDSVNASVLMEQETAIAEIFDGYRSGLITGDANQLNTIAQTMNSWEDSWSILPLNVAMDFIKDDNNMVNMNGNQLRVFPCKGFTLPVNANNALSSGIIKPTEKGLCSKTISFTFDKQYITKSDLMILDMMNNNQWKRAMYFSSAAGTEVSMALYKSGFLRQNGMAWEISPVKSDPNEAMNVDVMYDNMMNRYIYGDLKNPNVLTDYYARRQTTIYRQQFGQLANYFVMKATNEQRALDFYKPETLSRMRAAGQNKSADSIAKQLLTAKDRINNYHSKAIALIKKSLEIMPADVVLDYGEQANRSRAIQGPDGSEQVMYEDGNLHQYVVTLYRAGAKLEAEKLGAVVASQLESIINYFKASDAAFAGRSASDFSAAVAGYLQMLQLAGDKKLGNPSGTFTARLEKTVNALYQTDLPRIYNDLKTYVMENGESSGGKYSSYISDLQGTMEALGYTFGILESQAPAGNGGGTIPSPSMNDQAIIDESDLATPEMDETAAVRN